MTSSSLTCVLVSSVLLTAGNGVAESATSADSAFLPAIGQTAYYRYAETLTSPKGSKDIAATLALQRLSSASVQITIAVDGKGSRTLNFRVDQNGALQRTTPIAASAAPDSSAKKAGSSGESEQQRVMAQALLLRLSMVSRLGAHPGESTSFPVEISVPWAEGPVNPVLSVKSKDHDAFVAEANDSTSINPPQKHQRPHILLPLAAGFAGGAIGGVAGSAVGVAGAATPAVMASRGGAKPLPVDIALHVMGQLANGHLQTISGDQEEVVHSGKQTHTISEKWSLIAK